MTAAAAKSNCVYSMKQIQSLTCRFTWSRLVLLVTEIFVTVIVVIITCVLGWRRAVLAATECRARRFVREPFVYGFTEEFVRWRGPAARSNPPARIHVFLREQDWARLQSYKQQQFIAVWKQNTTTHEQTWRREAFLCKQWLPQLLKHCLCTYQAALSRQGTCRNSIERRRCCSSPVQSWVVSLDRSLLGESCNWIEPLVSRRQLKETDVFAIYCITSCSCRFSAMVTCACLTYCSWDVADT